MPHRIASACIRVARAASPRPPARIRPPLATGFIVILLIGALSACGPDAAQQAAQQAARQAALHEAEAARQRADYDNARVAGDWDQAAALGRDLQDRYRGTAAATEAARTLPDVVARATAANHQRRLAALWSYSQVPAGRGVQRAATILAKAPVALADGAATVQLVFRDHPAWGRNAYLVLDRGGFACPGRCTVTVRDEHGETQRLPAWKPTSHEAIALFIGTPERLWRMARGTPALTLTFPSDSGARSATFETGGAEAGHLPGWR
jgi:hypothetical protein